MSKRKKWPLSLKLVFVVFVVGFLTYAYQYFVLQKIPLDTTSSRLRHVILFIGDGMQLNHEIAASRYISGRDFSLSFHNLAKIRSASSDRAYVSTWDINTYNAYGESLGRRFHDKSFDPKFGYDPQKGGSKPDPLQIVADNSYFLQIRGSYFLKKKKYPATDSASSATAISTGVKTDSGNIAWESKDPQDGRLEIITETLRKKRNFAIGIATTVPFSHATPAAFASHNLYRRNYSSDNKKGGTISIAEEIIYEFRPDFLFGAGHSSFNANPYQYIGKREYDFIRQDKSYRYIEKQRGEKGALLLQKGVGEAIKNGKKVFALFGDKEGKLSQVSPHPREEKSRQNHYFMKKNQEDPWLYEVVEQGLSYLSSRKDKGGFFFLVEQGDIDWNNHARNYRDMLGSVYDLHLAVKAALDFIDQGKNGMNWGNSLILITSDHANSFLRLRKKKKLAQYYLPKQINPEVNKYGISFTNASYPGGEISYAEGQHSNELVTLYLIGRGAERLSAFKGKYYPGTDIIDNTDIYRLLYRALFER